MDASFLLLHKGATVHMLNYIQASAVEDGFSQLAADNERRE